MSFSLPNGSTLDMAATMGTVIPTTAVTNANPADCTVASGHGLLANDVVAVISGWSKLNNRAVEIGTEATTDATLKGIDTTSTSDYPAGGGVGSLQKVATWVRVNQITNSSSSGGDQQFVTVSFLESNDQFQSPTVRSPITLTFTVADDPTAAYFTALQAADSDRAPRVLRLNLSNGGVILYNALVTLSPMPSLTKDQVMTRTITLSLQQLPTRY